MQAHRTILREIFTRTAVSEAVVPTAKKLFGNTSIMGCMCARFRDKETPSPPPKKLQSSRRTETPDSRELREEKASSQPNIQLVSGQIRQLPVLISAHYAIKKKIRSSKEFDVFLAEQPATRQMCCIKIYPKPDQENLRMMKKRFIEETGILCRMDHPNVVRVYEVVEDANSFGIVAEALSGVTLMAALSEMPDATESTISRAFQQVLRAVSYSHSMGVIHSNISFTEVIVKDQTDINNLTIKLIGFGDSVLCTSAKKPAILKTVFAAPELLTTGRIEDKCDLWSCGIMLYMMLCGEAPFTLQKYLECVKRGKMKRLNTSGEKWEGVSAEAISLVSSMLAWDPQSRPTAAQCLHHPWIKSQSEASANSKVFRSSLNNLVMNQACSALKDAVKRFIVLRILKEKEISPLIDTFKAIDVDGDGLISTAELKAALMKVMPEAKAAAEADRIIRSVDQNENGLMDYTEFLMSAQNERQLLSTENLTAAFNSFDRDQSGKISMQELKGVFFLEEFSDKEHLWQTLLKTGDMSGDGEIDYKEFASLMRHAASSK